MAIPDLPLVSQRGHYVVRNHRDEEPLSGCWENAFDELTHAERELLNTLGFDNTARTQTWGTRLPCTAPPNETGISCSTGLTIGCRLRRTFPAVSAVVEAINDCQSAKAGTELGLMAKATSYV